MIELFEGDRADNYEGFVDVWIPTYRNFVEQLPSLIKDVENKRLLVAGCGTGNEIAALDHDLYKWQVTGVDPSPEMLDQARIKLSGFSNVELFEGLVKDLPADDLYGAATLLLVLHFLKDDGAKLSLLTQIARRLEVGAPFVLLDISGTVWQIRRNLELLEKLVAKYVEESDLKCRLLRIENELYYVDEERVIELIMQAGFERPTRFYQNTIYMGWYTRKV